jgi:asparagine synthase (glutamine-hydrolysing)
LELTAAVDVEENFVSAIFGFFGEGDMSLLRGMGARLSHRGAVMRTWRPAPNVFLGQWDHHDMGGAYEPAQLPLAVAATIYNAQDVASQIERRGRRRQDGTNQELVQMAFEVFGPECFAMFNGDFTIALWDERARRLILARDALGARVLYYWYGPRCVAFASEYKALLALGDLEAKPDLVALQHLQRTKDLECVA